MSDISLDKASIIKISEQIKNKKISATEVLKFIISQREKYNKLINAFIDYDSLKEKIYVENLEKKTSTLSGIPFAVKNNICIKGEKTTCASRMLQNYTSIYSATAVKKMLFNGMIHSGNCNMDEFSMGSTSETSCFGPVLNPHNIKNVPGGSSGGSAAAVASGMAYCALGTDTGGSIRQPSALCGVTGLKPTYGRVSRHGLIAYASSLDQIGPIARTATDCAAILDVICEQSFSDSCHLKKLEKFLEISTKNEKPLEGVKIAILAQNNLAGISPKVKDIYNNTAITLENLGCECVPLDFLNLDSILSTYYTIACAQALSNLARFDFFRFGKPNVDSITNSNEGYLESRSELFGEEVKKRILYGSFVLSQGGFRYANALDEKNHIKSEYKSLFEQFHAFLTPVTPCESIAIKTSVNNCSKDIFTVGANLAGLPAISFPCDKLDNGSPVGMQLMGDEYDEDLILKIVGVFQERTGYEFKPAKIRRN